MSSYSNKENNISSPKVVELLKILNELEDFTIELKKKLVAEIRPSTNGNSIRLNLEKILD